MIIDAYLTPYFPETETFFDDSHVLMIDVLRASSTVAAALYNGAKEVVATENLDKAVTLYSNLSKEVRFLGGERNGIMPSGFDAGNSPSEYTGEKIEDKTVIITTSNGTKIYQKAKQAESRIIASFVNVEVVLEYLKACIKEKNENTKFIILCAGNNGRLSYEDTLCAGRYIAAIMELIKDGELTDTAAAAFNLYEMHKQNLNEFIASRQHATYLKSIGFEKDIETCLTENYYPVVPLITGSSIKKI